MDLRSYEAEILNMESSQHHQLSPGFAKTNYVKAGT